jgi:TRAP transporter TAXI family solute receptor
MAFRAFGLATIIIAATFLWAPAQAQFAQPNWPATLTIATASPGGTYYTYGQGLARILTRVLRLPVAARPTEGPSENIRLIEEGDAQVGFVTMGVALQGWNGTADWTGGKEFRAMRAMFPMYDTPFHFIVMRKSPVQSLADMAGKQIGAGPRGGTAGNYVPRFFDTLEIEASLSYGTWEALTAQLERGELDVLAVAAGVPFPAVTRLEANQKIRYVPVSEDQIFTLRLAMPELNQSVIPAGTYPSLMKGYPTVGLYNFAVAHKDLPDDLVYRIVKVVFDYHQEMMEIHPAAASTVPGNFVYNTFLPYHDGAARYYGNTFAPGLLVGD